MYRVTFLITLVVFFLLVSADAQQSNLTFSAFIATYETWEERITSVVLEIENLLVQRSFFCIIHSSSRQKNRQVTPPKAPFAAWYQRLAFGLSHFQRTALHQISPVIPTRRFFQAMSYLFLVISSTSCCFLNCSGRSGDIIWIGLTTVNSPFFRLEPLVGPVPLPLRSSHC